MIRLIPLLAAFAVLLWHPTEGWSEESDILLEPDAVLTGTVIFEKTKYHTHTAIYPDFKCPIEIQIKNYRFRKWVEKIKASSYRWTVETEIPFNKLWTRLGAKENIYDSRGNNINSRVTCNFAHTNLEFLPNGSLVRGSFYDTSLYGTIERLEGKKYHNGPFGWGVAARRDGKATWNVFVEFSNPDYERRKALLLGESKETKLAAEPSLKKPEPEKIASLLEPDAVLTGTGGYRKTKHAGQASDQFPNYMCSFKIPLKNHKFSEYLSKSYIHECTAGASSTLSSTKLSLKFLPDGNLKSGMASNTGKMYPLAGTVEDSVGYKSGHKKANWVFYLKLSNPDYERRKALLLGESKETKLAAEPSLKKPEPEKIARVEKAEKARRLAEEKKQLAELARQKAAEKERKAEIARLKAEEEELAELARLKAAEKERKAEIARLKAEEEELAELARQKAEEKERKAEIARLKAAEKERKAELARRKTEEAKQQAKLVSSSVHFGTYHALVIGNDEYTDLPKLKNGVQDAKDMSLLLKDMYGFEVQTLLNANRDDIIGALSKLRAKLEYDNNLLIYYAGHGFLDVETDEGYWLPVDAGEDDPSNWLPVSTITNMVKAMGAKHVMIVADSCYSGTLVRSAPAKLLTAKERDVWLQRMARKRSRTAMVSGGLEPVMDGGGGKNSPFAKALMDVLRDNQSVMEGNAVYEALKRPVALASNQTPEYSDIRRAGHDGGEFLFVRTGGVKAQASTSEQSDIASKSFKQKICESSKQTTGAQATFMQSLNQSELTKFLDAGLDCTIF